MTSEIKDNLPFNPNDEIFRWGPIPGRFLYTSMFVEVNYKYLCQRYLGENWSETLFLFNQGRMLWLNDWPALRASGVKVFLKYLLPRESRTQIYQEWKTTIKKLTRVEEIFDNTNWSKLSNDKIAEMWGHFHDVYRKFWITGTVPELANYGSDKYLEDRLRPRAKTEANLLALMEGLTAPLRPSFYQEEEIDLAKTNNIRNHQQKYFWLKNSYAGTQIAPVSFFAERKKELKPEIENKITRRLAAAKQKKLELQRQFNVSDQTRRVAEAIADGVAWQDERKKHIFIVLHYQDLILNQIAKRFDYNLDDLHYLWYHEIARILSGEDFRKKIQQRQRGFGVRFFKDCQELTPEETLFFWNLYGQEKTTSRTGEVRGLVASKGSGRAKGRVHILLDPSKVERFEDNEVLVAPMTSPEYIFAMRKASAIITDTGGLTSHAAIVSRELGVPCIVGTKSATTVFKNGDTVEVDANTGIVKKI